MRPRTTPLIQHTRHTALPRREHLYGQPVLVFWIIANRISHVKQSWNQGVLTKMKNTQSISYIYIFYPHLTMHQPPLRPTDRQCKSNTSSMETQSPRQDQNWLQGWDVLRICQQYKRSGPTTPIHCKRPLNYHHQKPTQFEPMSSWSTSVSQVMGKQMFINLEEEGAHKLRCICS